METVTLEEALQLLSLPRVVGVDPERRRGDHRAERPLRAIPQEGHRLAVADQRRPAVHRHAGRGAGDLPAAQAARAAHGARPRRRCASWVRTPATGKPMVIKDGRFGPYVTDGETNASLRKGDSVEAITDERASELLADRRAKAPTPKKAPAKKPAATRRRRRARRRRRRSSASRAHPVRASHAQRGHHTLPSRCGGRTMLCTRSLCATGGARLLRRRQQRLHRRRHPLAVRPARCGRLGLLHDLAHLPRARRLARLGLHRGHRVPGERARARRRRAAAAGSAPGSRPRRAPAPPARRAPRRRTPRPTPRASWPPW